MSKVKKLFAIILSMAMILGMSLTTMAATESTITINNAGNGSFKAVQIVVADTTKDTGWNIVTDYQDEFLSAFDLTATSDNDENIQKIIKGMIYSVNSSAPDAVQIRGFDGKYQDALDAITVDLSSGTTAASNNVATLTVTSTTSTAGVWLIKGQETDYNYSPMAAYIDFAGVVTPSSGIEAKKAPSTVDKDTTDTDGVYEVGETINYEISTRVPYIPISDTNRHYVINDTITGATYDVDDNNQLLVTVTVKESQEEGAETASKEFWVTPTGNTFSQDISSFILQDSVGNPANNYQNWYMTISYSAVTTATMVNNDVIINGGSGQGTPSYGSDESYLISGTVTLTKTGEGDDEDGLADAVFVLVKTTETEDPENPNIEYGTFDENGLLTGWVETESAATNLKTNGQGQITVSGLDPTLNYSFKEIKAPDGYSINTNNATITWNPIPNKDSIDTNTTVVSGSANMEDTKLASLPSTGGMGTTIFTIGGCVIMIAAAGLYFASRRRQENK